MFSKIQYISQGQTTKDQINNITSVLEAGCNWVQLRYKNATHDDFLETAKLAKKLCEKYDAIFVINDHVELAKEIDADGVHLGLTDTSIENARIILGKNKIIGGTANTLEQVLQRIEEKCDYIGLGPFGFTTTKEKLSPTLGIEGYQKVMNGIQLKEKNIPIYAIGGIEINDVENILNTGIYGIALSGILSNTNNTAQIITQLNKKIYAGA